jgi:hypothetical protein
MLEPDASRHFHAKHHSGIDCTASDRLEHAVPIAGNNFVHRGEFNQRLAMAQLRAQRNDVGRGPKTPAREADAVEVPQPLGVRDVALAPGRVAVARLRRRPT